MTIPMPSNHQWGTQSTNKHGYPAYKDIYAKREAEKHYAKKVKPVIDFVEFGKAYDVSTMLMATDEGAVKLAYSMALDDYFKSKQENFPTWEGLPEIRVNTPTDSLHRFYQIGWYVKVPKAFVLDKDQIEEDKLWES